LTWRWLGRAFFAVFGLVGLYLAAAFVGALWTTNPGQVPAKTGQTVWVETNGAHTGIIIPWAWLADIIKPSHFKNPGPATHLMIGWGGREFYQATPTWAEFNLGVALRTLAWNDDVALNVQAVAAPTPAPHRVRLTFTLTSTEALQKALRAQFGPNAQPNGFSYGETDAFYPARGTYSPFYTCNNWTAQMLAQAGQRVGRWTPFAQGLMWSLQPR
jgi:uncharacterized protein (TIGR02117 family)